MKIRQSDWYVFSELLLDLFCISAMGILEWHFVLVLRHGEISVIETIPWVLFIEAYIMIPLWLVFGIYKLIEDIILIIVQKKGVSYIILELGLGITFLLTGGFVGYHLREIVLHGESVFRQYYPWLLYAELVMIPFCMGIGIYKFWEDFKRASKGAAR